MDRREEGTGEGVGVSERQGPGTSRGGGGLPSLEGQRSLGSLGGHSSVGQRAG